MSNTFKLSKKNLAKIDALLPRLKHSVLPTKIIRWLENFEENEMDLAIDLLSVLEFVPFNELMFRFNGLLYEIFKKIKKGDKIIIFPYGKVGKSGTLVTYPLRNTNAFKSRENDIILTHDYANVINPSSFNHIIFLDDFIGSGKTFCKEFSKQNHVQEWIDNNKIQNIYILSSIIMVEGKEYISNCFPGRKFNIISEEREKIFHPSLSPLIAFKNLTDIRSMALKYGNKISVLHHPPFFAPNGYDSSESLISFFHCTPNNTLPIIWGKSKEWFPLFPRMASIRMNEAREFKKEIAFYIGICNRLGIDLYSGKSIIERKNDKNVRIIKHNSKQDHAVIALLTLKDQGYENLIICHLLGLTRLELKQIYNEGKKLGFINTNYNISRKGVTFLQQLKEITKKEDFRKETYKNLEVKTNIFYLPQKFNGLT